MTSQVAVPEGVPQALTTGETAKVLRMNERTIRSWAESGTLPFQMVGGRRYITSLRLLEWANCLGWEVHWTEHPALDDMDVRTVRKAGGAASTMGT